MKKIVFFISLIFINSVCGESKNLKSNLLLSPQDKKEFANYWNRGQAEISRYSLSQNRYGETHKGDVVLVFVTEDFLTNKMVKNESYQKKNTTKVLKLNFNRKFVTGIYDYSTMTSVFFPVDIMNYEHALKVSTSSQEWCGHVYAELIKNGNKYDFISHSYFEKESFEDYDLDFILLEDEVMTRIRISPESLPLGAIKVIPAILDSRLRHYVLSVEEARAGKFPSKDIQVTGKELIEYRIRYTNIDRVFRVVYENRFPYLIIGFIEEMGVISKPADDSSNALERKTFTKAVHTHTIMSDYWRKNKSSDTHWRTKLGLSDSK